MSSKKLLFFRRKTDSLLLDLFPADLAYSFRKLSSSYAGNCIRVRRSSDNTEMDIGFVSNYLDTAALLSFVGGGSGFVKTKYDQSGNGNNKTNSNNSQQPRIVNGGTLELTNTKLSMAFDGSDDFLTFTSIPVTSNWTVFSVGKRAGSGQNFIPISGNQTGFPSVLMHFNDNNFYLIRNSFYVTSSSDSTANQMLLSGFAKSSSEQAFKNGVLVSGSRSSLSTNTTFDQVGKYNSAFALPVVGDTVKSIPSVIPITM